jgi:predicted  nucleic acid-binding Zn-ribbon protein
VTTYALSAIAGDQGDIFMNAKIPSPEVEKALKLLVAKKNTVKDFDRQIMTLQQQQTSIAEDQQRLRENMKALKGSAEEKELLQRYTRQLNSQEDQLDRLKKELADLRGQRETALADFNKSIQEMKLDVTVKG